MRALGAALCDLGDRREWPLLALTLSGWILLARGGPSLLLPGACVAPGQLWNGAAFALYSAASFNSVAHVLAMCGAMLLAMSVPLARTPILHVWRRSLASRRGRAVVLFACAYLAVWMPVMAGLVLLSLMLRIVAADGIALTLLIAVGVAVAWYGSATRRRCLNVCHEMRALPAFGWRAQIGVLRFGAVFGVRCLGACWALMLLPMVAGEQHLFAMIPIMLVAMHERYGRAPPLGRDLRIMLAGGVVAAAGIAWSLW